MASYATVPAESDLESEATLLNSKPKPKSSLIVGGVAAAAFVLGIIAATAVRSSPAVGVKTQLSRETDKCYITPGCTDTGAQNTDIHADYMNNEAWYCTKYGDINYETSYGKVTDFGENSFTVEDGSSHPYDECDIHTGCARAAFDQNYQKWRCFDEDDFLASSLSPHDFAYQARVAASVTYNVQGTDDTTSFDLFDVGVNENTDDKAVRGNNGLFEYEGDWRADGGATVFWWNTGWEGYPWSPAGYFFDTPDGWGSYNLWNREGKPDGVGYYKAEKNCDDPQNCFLQFWCLNDDGNLYYHC